MGLFDIFRRRSKKDKTEKNQPSKKPETPESEVAKEQEKPTSESAQSSASQEVPSAADSTAAQSETVASASSQAAFSQSSSEGHRSEAAEPLTPPSAAPESAQSDKPTTAGSDTQSEPESAGSGLRATPEGQSVSEPVSQSAAGSAADQSKVETANQTPHQPDETGAGDDQDVTDRTKSYEKGLAKSRSSFGAKLNALLANFRHVDESFFDDLEDMLIESDVGFETAMRIADELREEVKLQNAKKPKDVQNVIVEKLIDMYDQAGNGENNAINMAKSGPTVILMVGVNGVGKTTTIGKMAQMYKQQGKKVVLAAADTFRAGAIEQLNVWAKRDGVDIVKSKPKSDPSSVVFDAVKKARDENYDILLVDTAGRLQNKVNLMNELTKMKKILTREIPEAPHEVLLVLDATTGQNAMTQAKMFKEATDVTGIVLTKLDGTARGGIVLAIRSELHLPVKYVGLGEQASDLKPFDPNDFVYGLFKGLISE